MSEDALRDGSPSCPAPPAHDASQRRAAHAGPVAEPGLLDVIGDEVLAALAEDYLELLGTATSIHDVRGQRALGVFPSGWCAYLDRASRTDVEAGAPAANGARPRTACQRSCWEASRAAIERGTEFEGACGSGIDMFAVPIRAGTRVVGAINAAVGEPPRSQAELTRLAAAYGVDATTLEQHAARFPRRTAAAVEAAKHRLRRAAQLIGEMVARQAAERERERLFQAEARARARLQRLQEATAALAVALSPKEVASATIDAGARAAGAAAGCLLLARDGELELLASSGYERTQVEGRRANPERDLPVRDAVRLERPVLLGSKGEWLRQYRALSGSGAPDGLGATAVFPLVGGPGERARVLGAMRLDFEAEREFAPDDVAYLETLANLGAQALDRALAYEAERAARLEAEHANEVKAAFLAVMSHELRTPLNAIAGYTELLEMGLHGPTTPAQLEALGRIRHNQRHLLGHINDILDYARLEAGRATYRLEELAVAEAVAGVQPLVEPLLAARALTYQVELGEGLPRVRADRERLIQILANLLANAAKFTPKGGHIHLGATVLPGTIQLHVSDTGAGIPADKLESIFEPFVRVEGAQQRRTEGTGLGLAIARELARGMGGDLTAESATGVGATFTVTLRLA